MNKYNKNKISIVIPAYNEEKRIGKTLESCLKTFHDAEIFVAMDGCKDRTFDIVREYAKNGNDSNNIISYIYSKERLGKGKGLLRAIDKTKGDILVITDADESAPISEILKLTNSLDGNDCVIGSRWLLESEILVKQPLKRRIASRGFNLLVRTMFGLPFKDTQCGAKVIKKEVMKEIAENISTFNFAFDIDLLWQLQRKGYKIKEISITWEDKDGSSVRLFHEIITMFLAIVRLRIINSSLGFITKCNIARLFL